MPLTPEHARRLKNGDESVLGQIQAYLAERLSRLAKNRALDLDDLVQNTLITAWKARENLDTDRDLGGWLYGIAKMIVRNKSAQLRELPLTVEPSDTPFDESVDEPATNVAERIKTLSSLLEPLEMTILTRKHENPHGYAKELAVELELKPATIRAKARRAWQKIADKFPQDINWTQDRVIDAIKSSLKRASALGHDAGPLSLSPEQRRRVAESVLAKASTTNADPSSHVEPAMPAMVSAQTSPPQQRRYLPTGFETLDTLLGGRGLLQGSSVLLKGGAGTGKTTLALQMARHAIHHESHSLVYVSVEDRPEVLLSHITRSFWNEELDDYLGSPDKWHVVDLTGYFDEQLPEAAYEKIVRDALGGKTPKQAREQVEILGADQLRLVLEESLPSDRLAREVRQRIREMELDHSLRELWPKLPIRDDAPILLIVDSLNALVSSASVRFLAAPDRQILQSIFHAFQNWRRTQNNVTAIFIAEDSDQLTNAAASYAADTVIELRAEIIENAIRERPDQEPRKWLQDLRFCQVLKGRGLPIQRRSSCYEFVGHRDESERGIKFLPTYAAPGLISLFYENAPMREVIEHLRNTDVPATYPQIIVHEFSRSALQRVFSVRRHSTQVSLRQPLVLSNVDEHWLDVLRREDLLEPIPAKKLECFSLTLKTSGSDPVPFIRELWEAKRAHFSIEQNGELFLFGVPQIANVGMLVYRQDVLDKLNVTFPPSTWEELEECCLRAKKSKIDAPSYLLLETSTYDSFLTTALELIWSHGGIFHTKRNDSGGLEIVFNTGSGPANVVAALTRLKRWIHELHIVPKDSSVDPDIYKNPGWLFARHWYSTWIDVRTRTPPIEFGSSAGFGVVPIPIAAAMCDRPGQAEPPHHCAWGEWYLAIQRGSENIELGISLINNLMTARKITERALSGAAIPTVEKFYELADEICPETDLTFRQIRQQFFRRAKSRSEFDDYPRFARVFSGVLRTIARNPKANVSDSVRDAFCEIQPGFHWPVKDEIDAVVQKLLGNTARKRS